MTANPQGPVRVVPLEPTPEMLDAFWHGEGESAEMRARSHERGKNQWSRMLEAAAPEGVEAEVQYEVWQDGMMVAASDDLADAKHYELIYSQDGPVELKIATTTRVPLADGGR